MAIASLVYSSTLVENGKNQNGDSYQTYMVVSNTALEARLITNTLNNSNVLWDGIWCGGGNFLYTSFTVLHINN